MKMLWIGDVHAVPDELDDCQALMDLVKNTVMSNPQIDFVLFAGDLHHTHSIIRLEVSDFWRRNFVELVKHRKVTALVGNHDQPNDTSKSYHALEQYKDLIQVVDIPVEIDGILFSPYTKSEAEFKKHVTGTANTLMCHQTFSGSAYENGFYATDGFNPDGFPYIISGHIHSDQKFANVWYPGAPRWRSVMDSKRTNRAIWILEFNNTGQLLNSQDVPTNGICRSMYEIAEREGEPLKEALSTPNSIPVVSLTGSRAWTQERSAYWSKFSAKVSSVYTDSTISEIPESVGVMAGMLGYVEKSAPKFGTSKERLSEMIKERFSGF